MLSVSGYAQQSSDELKINYKSDKQPLKTIFAELEKKYQLQFSYSTESISEQSKKCDFRDSDLSEVLDYLLGDLDFEYKQVGSNVLLRKEENFEVVQDDRYRKSLHIKGKVVFDENDEALSFASISVKNSSIASYTDDEGNFDIEIPAAHFQDSLIVHYLGLEDQIYVIADIEKEYLLVPLSLGDLDLEQIVIVNRKKNIRVVDSGNAISLTDLDLSNMGLLGDDISRTLQKLAGVNNADDTSSDIKIRGSRGDETLVVLDNMPVYNCSHFYGVFNSINPNYVKELSLYKGYFPLEYGGKTGGIVELLSDTSYRQNSYADYELDLMTASASLSTQLTKNLKWDIAGRSTLRNISNTQFNTFSDAPETEIESIQSFSDEVSNNRSNPSFRFYDLNSKLSWKINDSQKLSLNVFNSDDQYSNQFMRKIKDPDKDKEVRIESDEIEQWKNLCGGINYDLVLPNQWKLHASTYYSSYQSASDLEYEVNKPNNQGNESDLDLSLTQDNEVADIGIKSILAIPIKQHNLSLGLEYINHDVSYELKDNRDIKIRGQSEAKDISFFVGGKIKPLKKLRIEGGLRSTYYENTDQFYFSPRVLISYNLLEGYRLKSSFGEYQQFIRQFPFEYRGTNKKLWVNAGENEIPVLESKNWMLGFSKVGNLIGLDVEFYYKEFDGLTEFVILNPGMGNQDSPGPRDYSLFRGFGYSKGVDVILNSSWGMYETYLSYTLSQSQERYKEISQEQFFDSEDDRRHQIKWINSYKWKQFKWGVDLFYLSGKPYTDINKLGSSQSISSASPSNRFSRIDPYNRIDLSMSYNFKIGKYASSLSFSVMNLFDIKNEKYIQNLSEDINENSESVTIIVGNESAMLARTLNVGWRMEFGKR